MAKRERPAHVPIGIQLAVAERQIGNQENALAPYIGSVTRWRQEHGREMSASRALNIALRLLFGDATVNLDHTWALIDRPYNPRIKNVAARYTPHANDPDYMEWRPKARDAERSHDIKTFVRGDRGQYSDFVLMKRERRRQRERDELSGKRKPKLKIKINNRNSWPTKGTRKMRWKKDNKK